MIKKVAETWGIWSCEKSSVNIHMTCCGGWILPQRGFLIGSPDTKRMKKSRRGVRDMKRQEKGSWCLECRVVQCCKPMNTASEGLLKRFPWHVRGKKSVKSLVEMWGSWNRENNVDPLIGALSNAVRWRWQAYTSLLTRVTTDVWKPYRNVEDMKQRERKKRWYP